jgi:hypothetical protein
MIVGSRRWCFVKHYGEQVEMTHTHSHTATPSQHNKRTQKVKTSPSAYIRGYLNLSISYYSSTHYYLENRTTDDKHSLLLPPHPLNNLIRALRQPRSRCIRRRHRIQFKQRRAPCKRYTSRTRLVMHLEGGWLAVQVGVEFVVEVD